MKNQQEVREIQFKSTGQPLTIQGEKLICKTEKFKRAIFSLADIFTYSPKRVAAKLLSK